MVTKLSNIDMSNSKYDLNVDLHFLTHLINDGVIILCQQCPSFSPDFQMNEPKAFHCNID